MAVFARLQLVTVPVIKFDQLAVVRIAAKLNVSVAQQATQPIRRSLTVLPPD